MANYLYIPGLVSGATTPHQAGLAAGTTPLDVRVECALKSWSGGFQAIINQNLSGGASGSRWYLGVAYDGTLQYGFWNTSTNLTFNSTVTLGLASRTSSGIRVLHNIAAGTVNFYTSPDFTTWTALGTQITGVATTTMATAGTAPVVRLGSDPDGEGGSGKYTKVQILVNSVTKINWDITTATGGTGPWTSGTGEIWTPLTTASVVTPMVAPVFTPKAWVNGTTVTAANMIDLEQRVTDFSNVLTGRVYTTVQSLTSYTLGILDAGSVIEGLHATALSITIPNNSFVAFPIGTVVEICQVGAGPITITPGSDVILYTPLSVTTRTRYSTIGLRQRTIDEWIVSGDLA